MVVRDDSPDEKQQDATKVYAKGTIKGTIHTKGKVQSSSVPPHAGGKSSEQCSILPNNRSSQRNVKRLLQFLIRSGKFCCSALFL